MKRHGKQRLLEVMHKVDPSFTNEGVNFNMLYQPNEYKKKAQEIKAQIDRLFREEEFDDIDTLYRLLVKRGKPLTQASPQELKESFEKLARHGHQE